MCSSYPTQLVVAGALAAAGVPGVKADGSLNALFVIAVSLGDATLVVALITWFIRRNGESMARVFVAGRPVWREVGLGVGLAPLVLLGVSLLVAAIRAAMPVLHNVPTNPMGALMRDPVLAVTFAVVVVLAGGVREELQRGFQLHRLTGQVCRPGAGAGADQRRLRRRPHPPGLRRRPSLPAHSAPSGACSISGAAASSPRR